MFALTIPVFYYVGSIYGKFLRSLSKKTKEAEAKSTSLANEVFFSFVFFIFSNLT